MANETGSFALPVTRPSVGPHAPGLQPLPITSIPSFTAENALENALPSACELMLSGGGLSALCTAPPLELSLSTLKPVGGSKED